MIRKSGKMSENTVLKIDEVRKNMAQVFFQLDPTGVEFERGTGTGRGAKEWRFGLSMKLMKLENVILA